MSATLHLARAVPQPPHASTTAPRWRRRHFAVLAGIAVLQALVRADFPLGQDAYWGARYGLDIIRTGRIPRTDTFSWTAHGRSWIPSSWGWNVVLGGAYDAFGYLGFWLLAAAVSIACALVAGLLARRAGAAPLVALAVYAPIGMLGVAAIPRAQTLSNVAALLIVVLTVPVVTSRGRAAVPWLLALCGAEASWMNLHSMALLGPVLVAVTGAAVLIGRRVLTWRRGGWLVTATGATALACLATPYGWLPITHAADVRAASFGLVTEWASAGFSSVTQILTLLGVVLGLALCWRAWRGGRFALAACLLILALATALAIRFLPMLAVAATPEVALVVGRLRVRERFMRVVVGAVAAVVALLGIAGWRDLTALEPMVSPQLIAAIPAGCHLLNDDLAGDAVILARPDVSVSLDGRYDMYGREQVKRELDEFAGKPGTAAELAREGVGCILGPTSTGLVHALRSSPGWRVAAEDGFRTLLVRTVSS